MSTKDNLVEIAEGILERTKQLSKQLSENSFTAPTLNVGASSDLWTTHDGPIDAIRSDILALTQRMDKLLEGPHGFLHEYVSGNWECGALYTLLEFEVLEMIPFDGTAIAASTLAEQAQLPSEKLLRILRLIATAGILLETKEAHFAHTAISETLVRDKGFRSWVGFQLFETRVASANLADSLRKPNPYWTGQAAFEHAWGMPMYDWHAKNPIHGKRFAQAMQSVSKNLDPGNGMITEFLTERQDVSQNAKGHLHLVEVSGKTGAFSQELAEIFPDLSFEVQDSSAALLQQGEQSLKPNVADRVRFRERDLFDVRRIQELSSSPEVTQTIFLVRAVLWNLDDIEAIKLIQSFIPAMQRPDKASLVISDLVSPAFGTFEPHIERAFRRRDVTLMTMHNVKQRTATEWLALINAASPDFKVNYREKYSSHSCRGLWQLELVH